MNILGMVMFIAWTAFLIFPGMYGELIAKAVKAYRRAMARNDEGL